MVNGGSELSASTPTHAAGYERYERPGASSHTRERTVPVVSCIVNECNNQLLFGRFNPLRDTGDSPFTFSKYDLISFK